MSDHLDAATQLLLAPGGITENALEKLLGGMLGNTLDMAEFYFQASCAESWLLEDGIVKEGSFNLDRGVGVRGVSGEKTGFAYSDEIVLPALERASAAARSIARSGQSAEVQAWKREPARERYTGVDPIPTLTEAEKVDLLRRVDAFARQIDSRVEKVTVSLAAVHDTILVAASDGTLVADQRPLVRMNVGVIVEQSGRRERGSAGGGGRYDFGSLLAGDRALEFAKEAVRIALVNLDAVDAPAGPMPVVLGPGWPGVLLHEAVGHGLEGDFNRKGSSTFSGRIGEQVASPACTVVDDGTLVDRRGSLTVDDEGTPSQQTVLIENGVLKGYMQDKMNARLMGMTATGNGRRQSYSHLPMPRMTNTYMLAGDYAPEEIIASVDKGVYAVNFGGGQVDITSGKFVFSTTEAYLIEGGKVTAPLRGATLIGSGPEVMTRVSMAGNDLALDTGVGVCGKDGQSVPVGVGQPTLRVDEVTVGGTQS
jgi:TldD protein